MIKQCIKCRKDFKTNRYNAKFCSMKCYNPVIKLTKQCEMCKKEFLVDNYRKNSALYCSYGCRNIAYSINYSGKGNPFYGKTQINLNKGKPNYLLRGKNHGMWKGDNVGYVALHCWIYRYLGKPTKCEHCGKDGLSGRKIHWANKSGKYLRDTTDWIRLCVKCHSSYDNLLWQNKM